MKRLQKIVFCLDNAVSCKKLFHKNMQILATSQNIFLKKIKVRMQYWLQYCFILCWFLICLYYLLCYVHTNETKYFNFFFFLKKNLSMKHFEMSAFPLGWRWKLFSKCENFQTSRISVFLAKLTMKASAHNSLRC